MPSLPPHEIYSLKLSCLNYGYALFEPNSNGDYDFVRVGDVGYISEDGKFMKLFNAFSDSGTPANEDSHRPIGFVPIAETYRREHRLEPLPPGLRKSESVRVIGGGLSVSGPVLDLVAGGSMTLSCSSRCGAALITKCRGTRHKARALKAMEDYMISNLPSWIQLARDLGEQIEMHDLVFVRECILTGDWANISWNSSRCDAQVDFQVGFPDVANIGLSFWGQWQQHVEVPARQGPFRDTPVQNDSVVLDQCIFLKGLRISERAWYERVVFRLKSSSGEKHVGKQRAGKSVLKSLSERDFKITTVGEYNTSFRSVQSAYDILALYIFETSDADLALIDDDDLFSLGLHGSETLEDICKTILNPEADQPMIDVSPGQVKVGRIRWEEKEPDMSDRTSLVVLDESMNMIRDVSLDGAQSSPGSNELSHSWSDCSEIDEGVHGRPRPDQQEIGSRGLKPLNSVNYNTQWNAGTTVGYEGGHFMGIAAPPPRCGILLNALPTAPAPNSPKQVYALSPGVLVAGPSNTYQPSSHSSASLSTFSTDDIVSSTSATRWGSAQASSSPAATKQPPRKIRFAPLPEPRRDEYEYDDDPLSVGLSLDFDSATSSPAYPPQLLLPSPVSPNIRPDVPLRSPNLNELYVQASRATLSLSFDGAELLDSGQCTETNTVIGSEYDTESTTVVGSEYDTESITVVGSEYDTESITVVDSEYDIETKNVVGSECGTDDTRTLSNAKKARWSRLLSLPKASSLKTSPRTPDEHGRFPLWRSPSRESAASGYSFRSVGFGNFFGSASDNGSSSSSSNSLTRRKPHAGPESMPVSPIASLRSGLSLQPVVSEAGTAASPASRVKGHAAIDSASSSMRAPRRLLNGRIYGRRPNSAGGLNKNAFATALDSANEFIEWGHGGMGSMRNASGGSSHWARLQSDKKLSIGYDDGTVAGDEENESGMNWVKKRREAREKKEREEREAKEKAERENASGDGEIKDGSESIEDDGPTSTGKLKRSLSRASKAETESSPKEVAGLVTLVDASEQNELRDTRSFDEKQAIDEKTKTTNGRDTREREHIYTAVTAPAPRPHHNHSYSHQNYLNLSLGSSSRSATHTPTAPTLTTEPVPHLFVTGSPLSTPGALTATLDPSPLGLNTMGIDDSSSSGSDSEEEEANEQARKTAIGAGVEKISRRKE